MFGAVFTAEHLNLFLKILNNPARPNIVYIGQNRVKISVLVKNIRILVDFSFIPNSRLLTISSMFVSGFPITWLKGIAWSNIKTLLTADKVSFTESSGGIILLQKQEFVNLDVLQLTEMGTLEVNLSAV